MAYGLRIKNASGETLIDENTKMIRSHSAGEVNFAADAGTITYDFSALSYVPAVVLSPYGDKEAHIEWSLLKNVGGDYYRLHIAYEKYTSGGTVGAKVWIFKIQ